MSQVRVLLAAFLFVFSVIFSRNPNSRFFQTSTNTFIYQHTKYDMFFCKGTNFEGAWVKPQTRFTYFSLRACSLVVERPAHNRVVVGSNPSGPILFTFSKQNVTGAAVGR